MLGGSLAIGYRLALGQTTKMTGHCHCLWMYTLCHLGVSAHLTYGRFHKDFIPVLYSFLPGCFGINPDFLCVRVELANLG